MSTRIDYGLLVSLAEEKGWEEAVRIQHGPGEAYRWKMSDHSAAPSLMALPRTGGTALVVSCGRGHHALALTTVCKSVTVSDPDVDAVRFLQRRALDDGVPNLRFVLEDPTSCLELGGFDLVVARGGDIPQLPWLSSLLGPAGQIALGAANACSPLRSRDDGPSLTRRQLKTAFRQAGLRLVRLWGAWRSADDITTLFALDKAGISGVLAQVGLPAPFRFLSSFWTPAYWAVGEPSG